MSQSPKIFASLLNEVINKELCMFCGGCIAACPVNVIVPTPDEKPALKGRCILCGLCYYSCPRVELPLKAIEQQVFERNRTEKEAVLGVHHELWSVQSTEKDVLKICQDGGVVTTLLRHALRKEIVDHAIVVGIDSENPWKPKAMVVSNPDELLPAASSKYTATGSIGAVADAVTGFPDSKLAIVGVPCQIQALRRMHTRGNSKLTERITLTIGLFCYDTYRYAGLIQEFISKQHGVDPNQITKMECADGVFRAFQGGAVRIEAPLKELAAFTLPGCRSCRDFTGELADISVGHVGSEKGWCTVITRTPKGDRLLREASEARVLQTRLISPTSSEIDLVAKLSAKKKERDAPYITE